MEPEHEDPQEEPTQEEQATPNEQSIPLDYSPEGTTTALIAIVGPRGGGKTRLMSALTPLLAPPERTVIISPVQTLGKLLGLPVVERYGSDKTNEQYFQSFLTAGKRIVLVMDEFDEFCPASVSSRNGGYCCDALYRIVNYGRNEQWGIGMLVSFRGSSDVTTNLLRAANVLFVARTQEPNALDYFSRFFGREYGLALHNLPDYVFVVWAEGRLFGYVKVEGGEIVWQKPPKGWPMPSAAGRVSGDVSSADTPSSSTETSEMPTESADTGTTSATNASGSPST